MTAPNGCAHCGIEARGHFQRWTAPSDSQRKERMLARRTTPTPDPKENP